MDNTLLCIQDIMLCVGTCQLNLNTCLVVDLDLTTHSSITFNNQKNHEYSKVVAHRRSSHSVACPTLVSVCSVQHC